MFLSSILFDNNLDRMFGQVSVFHDVAGAKIVFNISLDIRHAFSWHSRAKIVSLCYWSPNLIHGYFLWCSLSLNCVYFFIGYNLSKEAQIKAVTTLHTLPRARTLATFLCNMTAAKWQLTVRINDK